MPDEICEYCGKSYCLVKFNGDWYCLGWCLDEAKYAAMINEREAELEDRELWK